VGGTVSEEVDEAYVFFKNFAGEESFIRVIWEGPRDTYEPGEEVINDYGMRLDPVISKIEDSTTDFMRHHLFGHVERR